MNGAAPTASYVEPQTCITMRDEDASQEWLSLQGPLLAALGWKGGERNLREASPGHGGAPGLKEFRDGLAHLGFSSLLRYGSPHALDARLLPAVWIDKDNVPHLLANAEDQAQAPDYSVMLLLFVPASASATNTVSRFYPLLRQIFAISLLIGVLALAPTWFNMAIYDQVIASGSGSELFMLTIGVILALSAEVWFRHLRAKQLAYFGARVDHFVSCSVFERLLFLPPVYTERAGVAAQIARLRDFESVREFFTGPLASLFFEMPLMVIYLAAMAILAGPLVLVPVALLAAYGLLLWGMNGKVKSSSREAAVATSLKQEFLLETITKLRAIRQSGMEQVWQQRFLHLSARASMASFRAGFNAQIVETASYVLMTLGSVATLGLGVHAVIEQHLTTGALIAAMMLIWRIVSPMQMACASITRIQQLAATTRQVQRLLAMPVEHDPYAPPASAPNIEGHISFHRAVLRYAAEGEPALLGVSFEAKPGQIIAIRGSNGSGKSSILKLALGMYQPQGGSVRLDGIDIRQFDPIALRQNIAYVPQQADLFPGTVRDNLLLADPAATEESCIEALRTACAEGDVMRLPQGLDTVILGENAEPISFLLKSRICLARAYLRLKPVMLFDEASHSLGSENDRSFAETIAYLRGKCTVLMVTHREDHMRLADTLLVLNKGEMTHAGPPDQVLNALKGKKL